MESDKVLQRLELENRKTMLLTINKNLKNGIEFKTSRGIYVFNNRYIINKIGWSIVHEIKDINKQLEELTGIKIK